MYLILYIVNENKVQVQKYSVAFPVEHLAGSSIEFSHCCFLLFPVAPPLIGRSDLSPHYCVRRVVCLDGLLLVAGTLQSAN